MAHLTVEGVVENGQVRLREDVTLPERARVYVVVPDATAAQPLQEPGPRVVSPRLAHPERAADFAKQVIDTVPDAGRP
jgi:hypothetical protein